jgi:hypothetical protein
MQQQKQQQQQALLRYTVTCSNPSDPLTHTYSDDQYIVVVVVEMMI